TTEEATTEEATTEEESEVETELGDLPEYKASDYVTLGDYKGLEVTEKSPVNVTEEDVMSALEDSIPLENLTEGEVKDGDIANIDYEGTLDGVAFDGGTAQGTDLEIGSGTFIEGFEEGLIGVQVGEAVDLNLTFPESYHSEELAGKDVVFHVTVNSLQRAQDVTDDIVAEISEFKTVEEYKESIRKELEENQASQNRTATEYELINQVYNNATIDGYPEEALAYTLNRAKAYYESYASYYGMTTEDLMAAYGMDEETFMGELENVAKQTLSQEMVLIAVAEKEGLEPTEDEFAEGLEKYAQRAGSDAEALLEQYGENYIRNSLIQEKALEFLYENANISVEEETEIEIASEEETEEVSEAESETETEEVSETESETESESMSESESETESESES
ncbi:MAG: trigger factor, partial [Eubacteriales bacterium]|nr:trigger factor [Eubacteriales bacterium]